METENKLPKEFKEKWIAALRSGEYKQGKGTLLNNGKYCCLGVACKIAGYSDEDIKGSLIVFSNYELAPDLLKHSKSKIAVTLADMNDSGKKSFSEIADWIEKNL